MRLPSRHPLASAIVGCFLLLTTTSRATAADASPTPAPTPTRDPAIMALSAKLVAAPDDAARDALLAAAPPDVAHGAALRQRFRFDYSPLIYSGDLDRAWTLAQYAVRLAEQNHDALGEAKEEQSLGNIEGRRGDNHAALARFEKCKKVYAEFHAGQALAGINQCIGIIHLQFGDYRQALEDERAALASFQQVGYKDGLIHCYNSIGNIFNEQGMDDRAMDNYQQALTLAGNDESWQVYLFANMADLWEARGDLAQAESLVTQSLALAEKIDDKPSMSTDLQSLGGFHVRGDHPDFDRAEKEYRRALTMADAAGDKRRQTSVLTSLGELQRKQDRDLPGALALAERSAALAQDTGEPRYVWQADTLAGKLHRALGQPDAARAAFEEAIASIEDARGHLTGSDASATAFLGDDKIEPYQQMVALLVDEKRPAEALAMAERAKARVLVEILRSPKLDPAQQMTPAERANADRLATAVTQANRDLAAARAAQPPPPPEKLAALTDALAHARRDRDVAEQDFFIAHPELRDRQPPAAGTDAASLPLTAFSGGDRATLLEYVVADDQTFLFAVAGGGASSAPPEVRVFTLPIGRDALARRTQDFRRALADRSMGWQSAARQLGGTLLAPARSACDGVQRLVIVPDGPLWELPFQALAVNDPSGKSAALQTLWEKYPIDFAPSLTFLAQASRAQVPKASLAPTLLACGDPSLGNNGKTDAPSAGPVLMGEENVPLPDAARQVRELGKLYGKDHSRTLVGAEAHEDAFKKLAGNYDVIHFATHGFLNDQAPMYSRLLMSQTDLAPDEDGLLEAWEWLPLKLHARLAVLSACETGRGRIGAGEGVLGQSWALFAAGCPATVVSQWKVDSASTTELMLGFHRRLLAGEEPAEALREASLELSKDPKYRHPFYWAPFVLVGADERITPVHAAASR